MDVANSGTTGVIISSCVGLGGAILSWLLADARSKTRSEDNAERMKTLEAEVEEGKHKIGLLEVSQGRSDQANAEIHRSITRLDDSKASKEMVQNFKDEINLMRNDMKSGFNKLESLVLGKWASHLTHHKGDDGE